MLIVKPSVEFIDITPNATAKLARFARLCYQAEPRGPEKDAAMLRRIIANGHTSQLEHASASFIVTCDRGVTHEWVRSRIGVSYSQESTRFCTYASDKFDNQIPIVMPSAGLTSAQMDRRSKLFQDIESVYNAESAEGVPAQIARGVLPTALKTTLGVTNDFRAWRWFLAMRTSKKAHPQIRELAFCIWGILLKRCPVVFETIPTVEETQRFANTEMSEYVIHEDLCVNRVDAEAAR